MKKKPTSNKVLADASRRMENAVALADELTFLLWQRLRRSYDSYATRRIYQRHVLDAKAAFGPKAREMARLVSQAQANIERRAKEKAKA